MYRGFLCSLAWYMYMYMYMYICSNEAIGAQLIELYVKYGYDIRLILTTFNNINDKGIDENIQILIDEHKISVEEQEYIICLKDFS